MNVAWSLFAVLAAATGGDSAVTPQLNPDAGVIVLTSGNQRLEVSLRCPRVQLDNAADSFGGELPTKIDRRDQADGGWECSYQPVKLASEAVVERVLCAEWSAAGRRVAQVAAFATDVRQCAGEDQRDRTRDARRVEGDARVSARSAAELSAVP